MPELAKPLDAAGFNDSMLKALVDKWDPGDIVILFNDLHKNDYITLVQAAAIKVAVLAKNKARQKVKSKDR